MKPHAVPVIELDEAGSTNADAMARAMAGAALPFWLATGRQTAGKGRSGRVWYSDPGNLHASLALGLSCDRATSAQLALVAGVGVIDAIRAQEWPEGSLPERALQLKWPNDILIGGAKTGGILIESASDRHTGRLIVVIGIGVNLVSAPHIEGRRTTHLAAHGTTVSPKSMIAALATTMDSALAMWNEGEGFARLRQRWLDSATPEGTEMTVNTGTSSATGHFAGVDQDGALLMKDSGGRLQRFTFGDVTLASAVAP